MKFNIFKAGLIILFVGLVVFTLTYYPKYKSKNSEATISWDVSGYYLYLPVVFFYDDFKNDDSQFLEVHSNYLPDYYHDQYYKHESGKNVMKYSSGIAFHYLPFFCIAHQIALASNQYPADGFSLPYQFMISLGSALYFCFGLWVLWHVLKKYFSEKISFITVVFIAIGTNALEYGLISSAMSHSFLFTDYCILLYLTIRNRSNPSLIKSVGIGLIMGLMVLSRPTELLAVIIPLTWGIKSFCLKEIKDQLDWLWNNVGLLVVSAISLFLVASIQLMYWKYTTGDWIVYSYQGQGFSWLRPHLFNGIFSYKSGWLTYSPLMLFSLIGIGLLFTKKDKPFSLSVFLFSILFIYVAFAWDEWTYGGSLGQRTMVQSYPMLALALASFLERIWRLRIFKFSILTVICSFFIIYNLWLTHNCHLGGIIHVGQMTKAYFWSSFMDFKFDKKKVRFLDNSDKIHFMENYESSQIFNRSYDSPLVCNNEHSNIDVNSVELLDDYKWFRASALVQNTNMEWDRWKMCQFGIRIKDDKGNEKVQTVRIDRILNQSEKKELVVDLKVQNINCKSSKISVFFWNAESNNSQKEIFEARLVGYI